MNQTINISVLVKTNARKTSVEKIDDQTYHVSVKAPPIEGKANEAVIKAIAEYFSIPPSHIQIIRGLKGKKKILKIVGSRL